MRHKTLNSTPFIGEGVVVDDVSRRKSFVTATSLTRVISGDLRKKRTHLGFFLSTLHVRVVKRQIIIVTNQRRYL